MQFHLFSLVLLAAGSAKLTFAHTTFTNFYVDGVNQGDGFAVRMNNNPGKATFPINGITSPEMACGMDGEKAVSLVASVKAGATLTFEWRDHPDGSAPGAIDISHKGPCAVYMKKVENAAASNNAAGDGWFKIMELGYDQATKQWCTEKLSPSNGHLAATVPKDLASGYYLVRPELLALHQADKNPPDPQFYVGCAQVFLSSNGNSQPKDTVSIPGYVSLSTPAMTYNVWREPLPMPFPDFGPPLYTSQQPKFRLAKRDLAQIYGLKPDDCAMTNANWCAFKPSAYSDQDGCWAASKNCSAQLDVCYKSAPPTGSQGCKSWESYCTKLRNQCGSANYQGPPSCENQVPSKPKQLTGSVVSANGPMPSIADNTVSQSSIGTPYGHGSAQPSESASSVADEATISASSQQSQTATVSLMTSESSAPAETASSQISQSSYNVAEPVPIPVASPVSADHNGAVTAGGNRSSGTGSIDECGSRNGQKCQTGMCCSSHGYCGVADEYCGEGCQSQFGSCLKSTKHRRSRSLHSHVMRKVS